MKVLGYVRASTDEQTETLKVQKAKIQAYCALHDLELVEVYIDPGVSGTVPIADRPEAAKMLQAMKGRGKQKIHGMITVKLDRMFRNAADCLQTVAQWEHAGVGLHIIDLMVDTSSASGKFFLTVMAGVAEMERNLIAERTSAVLQSKKASGQAYSPDPLGYDRQGDKLVRNEEESRLIARIQSMRDTGLSYKRIAEQLNAEGIKGKRGGKWGSETIRYLLTKTVAA
jgi:site-specific DNA recombinase